MESASALMRDIVAAISPAAIIEHGGGADSVARDETLLREMLEPAAPDQIIRLWVNDPCLVTTRRLASYPLFESARAMSEEAGWPVHVRASGGSTVVHRPGVLNVSLLYRTSQGPLRIEDYYAPLTQRLIRALGRFGVQAATGRHIFIFARSLPRTLGAARHTLVLRCMKVSRSTRLSSATPAETTFF